MLSLQKAITGRVVAVCLILSLQMGWTQCIQVADTVISSIDRNPMTTIDAQYTSDYEMQIKSANGIGKHFLAYFIDEGDLSVKKHCKCQPMQQCKSKATVQLSK